MLMPEADRFIFEKEDFEKIKQEFDKNNKNLEEIKFALF
jgi:hypothetical protein